MKPFFLEVIFLGSLLRWVFSLLFSNRDLFIIIRFAEFAFLWSFGINFVGNGVEINFSLVDEWWTCPSLKESTVTFFGNVMVVRLFNLYNFPSSKENHAHMHTTDTLNSYQILILFFSKIIQPGGIWSQQQLRSNKNKWRFSAEMVACLQESCDFRDTCLLWRLAGTYSKT